MRDSGKTAVPLAVALTLAACAMGTGEDEPRPYAEGGAGDAGFAGTGGQGGDAGFGGSGGTSDTGGTSGSGGTSGTGGTGASGAGGTGGSDGGGWPTGGSSGAATGGTGGTSTGGTGGTGGTSTGGTGGTGGSTVVDCAFVNTCQTARNIGAVRGDEGSDTVQTEGYSSEWLRVRVNEADESLIGKKLKVTITLQPANQSNFDLFVFVNEGSDAVECTTVSGSSMKTLSQTDVVTLSWGESAVPNGKDDDRWVSIEVRHMTGTCDTTKAWTLTVKGN
jgi:hypothetical protein